MTLLVKFDIPDFHRAGSFVTDPNAIVFALAKYPNYVVDLGSAVKAHVVHLSPDENTTAFVRKFLAAQAAQFGVSINTSSIAYQTAFNAIQKALPTPVPVTPPIGSLFYFSVFEPLSLS